MEKRIIEDYLDIKVGLDCVRDLGKLISQLQVIHSNFPESKTILQYNDDYSNYLGIYQERLETEEEFQERVSFLKRQEQEEEANLVKAIRIIKEAGYDVIEKEED